MRIGIAQKSTADVHAEVSNLDVVGVDGECYSVGRGSSRRAQDGLSVQSEGADFDGSAAELQFDRTVKANASYINSIGSQRQGLRVSIEPIAVGHGLGHAVVGAAVRQ